MVKLTVHNLRDLYQSRRATGHQQHHLHPRAPIRPYSDSPTYLCPVIPQRHLDRFRSSPLWHCRFLRQQINGPVNGGRHVPSGIRKYVHRIGSWLHSITEGNALFLPVRFLLGPRSYRGASTPLLPCQNRPCHSDYFHWRPRPPHSLGNPRESRLLVPRTRSAFAIFESTCSVVLPNRGSLPVDNAVRHDF